MPSDSSEGPSWVAADEDACAPENNYSLKPKKRWLKPVLMLMDSKQCMCALCCRHHILGGAYTFLVPVSCV